VEIVSVGADAFAAEYEQFVAQKWKLAGVKTVLWKQQ
jgi:hypothetical protein